MAESSRVEIASEVGRLEGELARFEIELKEVERQFNKGQATLIGGAIALAIGAVVFLFTTFPSSSLLLSIPLAFFGLLATIDGAMKRNKMAKSRRMGEEDIASHRAKIAELKAQLLV